MMEQLKQFCPVEVVKGLGAEAIWLYRQAQAVRAMVAEITFESWEDEA